MKLILLFLTLTALWCHSAINQNEIDIQQEKNIFDLVLRNDVQGVEKMLESGTDVNTADNGKRSLLLIATHNGYYEMAELLVKHEADVNQQAENLDSAFLYAGASGQTGLVQLFLENGARFHVFNRYHGSALIPASERSHVETVRLLANTRNYPIDHINRLGWTALMEAVILGDGSKKYQQVVQILKEAGATLDIPDHDGITPPSTCRKKRL